MTSTSFNIASKIDPVTQTVLVEVAKAAIEVNVAFLVVGASARDLLMHLYYEAKIQRATEDIDFGVQVVDWDQFNELSAALKARGFTSSKVAHRLISPNRIPIDIVPFGGVETSGGEIHWPPEGFDQMTVLGFSEAFEHAVTICINEKPDLQSPLPRLKHKYY